MTQLIGYITIFPAHHSAGRVRRRNYREQWVRFHVCCTTSSSLSEHRCVPPINTGLSQSLPLDRLRQGFEQRCLTQARKLNTCNPFRPSSLNREIHFREVTCIINGPQLSIQMLSQAVSRLAYPDARNWTPSETR